MFSAIAIQWVTSKDNAGTSTNSSIGGGNGGMRPSPRDGDSFGRGFPPCLLESTTPPSTPADISLATTTRCSHGVDYDAASCDSTMTAAKMLAEQKRPTVVVTTTIARETTSIGPAGVHRNSHVDTEVAAESRRASRGMPWSGAFGYGHARSSS